MKTTMENFISYIFFFSGVIFNFNTLPVLTNQLTYFIFGIKRIYLYHLQNLTFYGTSYIYK